MAEERCIYVVESPITEDSFNRGMENITTKQLDALKRVHQEMVDKGKVEKRVVSDFSFRYMAMTFIVFNKICAGCSKKDDETQKRMSLCSSCSTEWYCSDECKSSHHPVHSKCCGDVNGEWIEANSVQSMKSVTEAGFFKTDG